jgi:hypothetical protein
LQLELDNIISVRFIPILGANTNNIKGHATKKTFPCSSYASIPHKRA